MRRIHLIINPKAGHRAGNRYGAGIAQYLRRAGLRVEAQFTRGPRDAIELARQAVTSRPDAIIIAGGDGTLHEVVNGLLQSGAPQTLLGLIPIGTGNDFAKMLDLRPHDWRAACARILAGKPRQVDAGQVNETFFINGVGIGFDAQVALEANRLKYLPGSLLVYAGALLKTLLHRYRTPHITLETSSSRLEQTITLLTVGNGRCHGGAFRLTPDARVDDGLFDILIADAASRYGILKLAPRVMRGTHLGEPGTRLLRDHRLQIHSAEPLVVHADGEILGDALQSLDFRLLPGAVRFIC